MLLGRFLTVRRGLTFIILLLAGLIQALMLVVLTSSYDKLGDGRELTRTSQIAGHLSTAARHWAQERGLTAVALATEAKPDAKTLQAIGEARRKGREAFEQTREALARNPGLRPKASLLPEIEADLAALEPIRRRFDAAQEIAGSQRTPHGDPKDARVEVEQLTRLIEKSHDLSRALLSIGEELEPAASLIRLQNALTIVVEQARREQAILDAARAAGRELAPPQLEQLGRIHGRRAQAWQTAADVAAGLHDQNLKAAVAAAGESGNLRSQEGQQTLDRLLAAQAAAKAATVKAAAELADVSEGAIMLGFILLGGAMFCSAFALAIIHFGLYRPLARMVEATGRLAQIDQGSEPEAPFPSHRRQDELGALARTLESLRARLGHRQAA